MNIIHISTLPEVFEAKFEISAIFSLRNSNCLLFKSKVKIIFYINAVRRQPQSSSPEDKKNDMEFVNKRGDAARVVAI